MLTIWKYPLKVTDEQELELPKGATILSVQTQNEIPCLWALVSTDAEKVKRTIYTCGTGNPVPPGLDERAVVYAGTYQLRGGALVFHVFVELVR